MLGLWSPGELCLALDSGLDATHLEATKAFLVQHSKEWLHPLVSVPAATPCCAPGVCPSPSHSWHAGP